jgi:hypothetical protein
MVAPLPRIDEHWIEITASPERVWAALEAVVTRAMGGGAWQRLYARIVGARDTEQTGHGLTVDATLVGFRVVGAAPPRDLRLEGAHRFARYAVRFWVEPAGSGARVGAITDADFPGLLGRGYRMLVIGSGGHALVVRSLLRAIKKRARSDRTGHWPVRRTANRPARVPGTRPT